MVSIVQRFVVDGLELDEEVLGQKICIYGREGPKQKELPRGTDGDDIQKMEKI